MASRLELAVRNTDRVVSQSPGQSITAARAAQCGMPVDDPALSRRQSAIAFADGLLRFADPPSAAARRRAGVRRGR